MQYLFLICHELSYFYFTLDNVVLFKGCKTVTNTKLAFLHKFAPKSQNWLIFMENGGVNVSTGLQTLKPRTEIKNVWEI